jgi:hypothetical protein
MKKTYRSIVFIFTAIGLLLQASPVYAALCPQNFQSLCSLRVGEAGGIVARIVTILLILAIILTLFYLIYGGIKWITSGGDKGKIDEARKHISSAIIGLIISLAAFFIVGFFMGIFGFGFSDLRVPTLLD